MKTITMKRVGKLLVCCLLGMMCMGTAVLAQETSPALALRDGAGLPDEPVALEILGLRVDGVTDEYTRGFIQQASGLTVGQQLVLPGDPALGEAIRNIYKLGLFSDVKLMEERRLNNGVYLVLQVRDVPKLAEYTFTGVRKSHRDDLKKEVPLIARSPVRPASIERTTQVIKEFYTRKGHPLTQVEVIRTPHPDNTLSLEFRVDRGPKVEVGQIAIEGNTALSDRKILGAMKTKRNSRWRFWRSAKFDETKFDEDLGRIVELYNERGYYDARIVQDTVYLETGNKPQVVVNLNVEEGRRYFIRSIDWEGNTTYTDEQLTTSLGLVKGEPYNGKRLEQNLYGNKRSTDVSSLYLNQGYMRFNAQPTIRVIGEDSLDLHFDVFEGDLYKFGAITISGNTKTKEHVVRRELFTVPGETFSRDAIQESVRRLIQLNYFTQESLAAGPNVQVNEEAKAVDLTYNLEETGSDQLELSGTWGRFGLVLQLGFTFNNFSAQNLFKKGAWNPLPAGDGQRLQVGVQTNGQQYQRYSLSYTEPWLRGKPTPVGFSLSFSRLSGRFFRFAESDLGSFRTASASVFYEKRLHWPDNFFSTSTTLGYQFYDNSVDISSLPNGVSQQVSVTQSLTRNSTDHPIFPSVGSKLSLSLEVAPPLGDLIQYHKWRLQTSWNTPITRKVSLGVGLNYGYIGSFTDRPVEFERFLLGGSPFETQSFTSYFGKEIIYMRGYPLGSLGPRLDDGGSFGEPFGGRILNKYQAELRWMAIQSEQLQAAPYLFFDAANTWDGFRSYNPSRLFRSAGFGIRLFLPILGMVELAYGYNIDLFPQITSGDDGTPGWNFVFTLGQGFNE
jgi:outer membrane protein insertion porin family